MLDETSDAKDSLVSVLVKFLKFCLLSATVLYLAATVVVLLVLHHPVWHVQLLRFVYRTWGVFVAEQIGSTSPGFINSIIVAVVGFILTLIGIGLFQGRAAMRQHAIETVAMGVIGLATVLSLVYGTQFAWEVAKAGYQDHQNLVSNGRKLTNELSESEQKQQLICPKEKSCPSAQPVSNSAAEPPNPDLVAELELRKHTLIASDPSFQSVSFIVKGLQGFQKAIGGADVPCTIRITATKDSIEVAKEVAAFANLETKCKTISPNTNYDLNPDQEKDDTDGMIDGALVIRTSRSLPDPAWQSLYGQIGFLLHRVKRSYEIPKDAGPNYVWFEFGKGVRWNL